MAKNPTFSVRIPADKKDDLYKMADRAGVPLATMAQRLLVSALEYFEENGDVPMPPYIVRGQEYERMKDYTYAAKLNDEQWQRIREMRKIEELHNGESTANERKAG